MIDALNFLGWLLAIAIGVVSFIAVLQLFAIRRLLSAILQEMHSRSGAPSVGAPSQVLGDPSGSATALTKGSTEWGVILFVVAALILGALLVFVHS